MKRCLFIICILLFGYPNWNTKARAEPRRLKFQQKCLVQETERYLSFQGSLLSTVYNDEKDQYGIWRLRNRTRVEMDSISTFYDEPVGTLPPHLGLLSVISAPQRDYLLVEDADSTTIFQVSGETAKPYFQFEATWGRPNAMLTSGSIVFEATDGAIRLIEPRANHPAKVTKAGNFPQRMLTAVDVPSGFYVNPQGERVVYDAWVHETRGLVMSDFSSKRTLWSTDENLTFNHNWSTPIWSPQGDSFLYVNMDRQTTATSLVKVDSQGSVEVLWDFSTSADDFEWIQNPVWSPDGNRIALWGSLPMDLTSINAMSYPFTLYFIDLSRNTITDTCHRSNAYRLYWSPDSSAVVYQDFEDTVFINVDSNQRVILKLKYPTQLLGWLSDK